MSYPDKPYSALGPLRGRADYRQPPPTPRIPPGGVPPRVAWFDSERIYRYRLDIPIGGDPSDPGNLLREWIGMGPREGACMFVMLNPSTADEVRNDPTVRRCIGYARAWGYAKLIVGNIFALRSTDPKALYSHPDPVGPENDHHLVEAARAAPLVVCGWGNHGMHQQRGRAVVELLRAAGVTPTCLTRTRVGEPGHPLYLRADLEPQEWTP